MLIEAFFCVALFWTDLFSSLQPNPASGRRSEATLRGLLRPGGGGGGEGGGAKGFE